MLWLLEVDPNSVRAGWLPLLIVLGIGVLIVLLYLSMRHEIKKIRVPYADEPVTAEERAARENATSPIPPAGRTDDGDDGLR